MGHSKAKVKLHLSLFDWRVAMGFGFLLGVVIVSAPQFIGMMLLLAMILGVLKLVEKGRI